MSDTGFQFLPGFLPRDPTDTQVEAERRVRHITGGVRKAVYEALKTRPSTDDELVELLRRPANTVRPRRVELMNDGFVVDSKERRPSANGSPAIVWKVLDDDEGT